MSAVSSPATDVDLLRAIRELADPAAHEAGSEVMFTGLLERLLDCEAVVVEGEVQFRRPANRPFGEREEVLCDLLRPHVSAWLAHQGESRARSGRSAQARHV